MAEKMSTIVMRVDLECDRCYKKIRKVLCKLQDRANIKTISYDERSKTVTVSGPFDAEEVSDKLCSDAGKIITDVHVVRGNAKAPNKPGKIHTHGAGHDAGHGGGGGGNGGKPEKIRHVKFDLDDESIDMHAHHAAKPRVATAANMSRLEAPRAGPPMAMASMAPAPAQMSMPMQAPAMVRQATAVPSIWPAPAPEWGYSAPAYGGGLPAGAYYGGPGPVHDHGGYGYGRNPYQPAQYYEEPSAACSVM